MNLHVEFDSWGLLPFLFQVSKVTKEQLKVHDSSNDPSVESLQEMLVKMSSRVSNLESCCDWT